MLMLHLGALVASLSAAAASAGQHELSRYTIEQRTPNAAHAERQVIETCAGSLVFSRCPDGITCAPPGYTCCGFTGACDAASTCIDGRACCPPFVDPAQCRAMRSSLMADPSGLDNLFSSVLGNSAIMSFLTGSGVPTAMPQPTNGGGGGGGGGGGAAAVTQFRPMPQASTGAQVTGNVAGGKGTVSAVSTRSRKYRSLDLNEEVELTDKWETSVSCDPTNPGKRTNATGATMKMELATDVAGFTVSHSYGTDGKMSVSVGGVDVSADVMSVAAQGPTSPTGTGTDTGCTVTYKWTRSVSVGAVTQSVSISWEFPMVAIDKRQTAKPWGQINAITVFSNAADVDTIKLGSVFDASKGGEGAASAAPSAPSPIAMSGARGLGVSDAIFGLLVSVALVFV